MKRLVKKSKFYNTTKDNVEIFKNPTNKEIQEIKNSSEYKDSIRGVIEDNGDEYCWNGDILHQYVGTSVDTSGFRFSYDGDINSWFFNAHRKYTLIQSMEIIIKYEDMLSKYGNLQNSTIDIDGLTNISLIAYDNINDLKKQYNIKKQQQ